MGNSVKLCLLLATHLVARARTHQTKIMIFEKAFISYLVIMTTCSGLPVNQEEAEVVIKDEATFEELRDHDLQLSTNGGQSGGWFLLFESEETSSRPKRQQQHLDAMADDLVVPPVVLPVTVAPTTEAPAPIDDAYAQRLEGSAIALANKLANAKRQKIERVPGYGRKKRQAPVQPVTVAPTVPTTVRSPGYGRKKRQISEEEETILQEISEIESLLPESTVIQVVVPQVTSWGETGILLPTKE